MMSKTKADKTYEKNVTEFLTNIGKDPDKVLALIDAICMEQNYLYQCSICEATTLFYGTLLRIFCVV